jgi:hypothetical protein
MSDVSDDAQQEKPHRPLALRGAKVSPGSRGDFSVTVWLRSEAEAVEVAALLNERLDRKPREAAAP